MNVDWDQLLSVDTPLLEIFLRGSLVYLGLFILLRVVLKREVLPLGEWLKALLQETAAISSEMQAASQTLHDFLLQ